MKGKTNNDKFNAFRKRLKTTLVVPSSFLALSSTEESFSISSASDVFLTKYEILEVLGKGAHSVVKKVREKTTDNIYACKYVRSDDEEIQNLVTNLNLFQFTQEYKMLKSMNHPGIVKVKEQIQIGQDGHNYIIMEFINGPSLRTWHREQRRHHTLSEAKVLEIIASLLCTVRYLHEEANICHRDIKPANVIVFEDDPFDIDMKLQSQSVNCFYNDNEEIDYSQNFSRFGNPQKFHICTKLVDFGVAFKLNKLREGDKIFEMLTPTGTPDYKAPEMNSGEIFNEKIDIWSIGITLLELVKGNRMIKSDTNMSFDFASTKVRDLLECLLQPNPDKRVSAKEALDHASFGYSDFSFKNLINILDELPLKLEKSSSSSGKEELKYSKDLLEENEIPIPILSRKSSKKTSPNKTNLVKLLQKESNLLVDYNGLSLPKNAYKKKKSL